MKSLVLPLCILLPVGVLGNGKEPAAEVPPGDFAPALDSISFEDIDAVENVTKRGTLITGKLLRAIVRNDKITVEAVLNHFGNEYTSHIAPAVIPDPLMFVALVYRRLDVVELMLERGVSPEIRNSNEQSLLDLAVMLGYVDEVKWLLERDVVKSYLRAVRSIHPTPLHLAASLWHRQMVEVLLEHGQWGVNSLADDWLHPASQRG